MTPQSDTEDEGDARGCFVLFGIFLVFLGAGFAFGWGTSLLVTGVLLIALAVLAGVKSNGNRPDAHAKRPRPNGLEGQERSGPRQYPRHRATVAMAL
jgi:hypothetical protein